MLKSQSRPEIPVTMSYKVSATCLKSSWLALFLLFLQAVSGQSKFQDLEQEFVSKQKALGKDVVLMLWKDTLIYKKELGEFNTKTQAPIGSASQWLTAALVMIYADEGKLSLDDKVSRWLPEFERYNKNYITIRGCLAHLTGIKDEDNFMRKVFQPRKAGSLEEEVNRYAAKEIRTNPGTDFWYGNMGANIAARVIEVISKKNFDVIIKQKLFTPLAMRRTTFTTMDGSPVNPASGATTTGDDFIKFLVMLLNKGKANGKQVLSEESAEELRKIQTASMKMEYAPKAATGMSYSLGSWVMEEKDGKAAALSSLGLFGTFPVVDFCRNYALLILPKKLLEEEKTDAYMPLKKKIDEQIASTCN